MKFHFSLFFSALLIFNFSAQAGLNLLDLDEPQVVDGRIIIESNDAGEAVTLSEEEYTAMTGQSFMTHLVSFFNFKMSWEKVASYITTTMEEEFDAFILVNVDYEGRFNGAHEIPAQHMKVLERTRPGQAIFKRQGGVVVGIRNDVAGNNVGQVALEKPYNGVEGRVSGKGVLDYLMPISSGAGHLPADPQAYVDTPTGIYRINHQKSDIRRHQKGMWHSLFFDLVYPSGKVSGLAIHGTSIKNEKILGKQASHGCIRTTQAQAKVMYENFINNDDWWTSDLPNLNNRKRLKSENGGTKAGTRALIILFYGYDKPGSFDI